MANRTKGEVVFTAGEDDEAEDYTLVLDFNALCDLEEDFPGIMGGQVELSSPKAIRKVFQIGLAKHHAKIDERAAGDVIQAIGIEKTAELVGEAFSAAFPEAAKKGKARPAGK